MRLEQSPVVLTKAGSIPIIKVLQNLTSDERHLTALTEAIDEAVGNDGTKLIIDFTATDYLASTTIGLLAKTYARLSARNGKLVIVISPNDTSLQRILKVTRLTNVLDIVDSLTKAIGRLAG